MEKAYADYLQHMIDVAADAERRKDADMLLQVADRAYTLQMPKAQNANVSARMLLDYLVMSGVARSAYILCQFSN